MKACFFVKSAREDLLEFPEEVRRSVGYAIFAAQNGEKAAAAKPLKGFGPGVLEVVENHDGDTYRAVYTVKFKEAVYVLHAFKKKSTKGIGTPKHEMDLVKARLRLAVDDYGKRSGRDD